MFHSEIALTDFGLSRRISDVRAASTIAPRWSSPELLESLTFATATDVWASGNKYFGYFGLPNELQ